MKKYPLYYYISWPDSQKYQNLDDDDMFTFPADEGAILAEKDWVETQDELYGL